MAFLAQVPIQDIYRAVTWSLVHTFSSHYAITQQSRDDANFAQGKVLAPSSEPPEPWPPAAAVTLPVSYRLSNTRLAFFLKETGAGPGGNASAPLQRSEPFVVFQTKELPVLNVSLGPFSTGLVLPREQLQPSSTLEIPDRLTVNWKVRAFIIQPRVLASQPVVQVLFYVAGRDWDDFDVTDRLPCVRLHAFREAREIKSSCRLRGSLATCLVQAELPHAWFGPSAVPLGRRKVPEALDLSGESQQAELYYTLHAPDGAGECPGETAPRRGGGAARTEGPTQHPLLRIGSISLFQPPPAQLMQEHRLDGNIFIRLPDKPLKPGEVLSILLYLMANSTVEHFTLRVKAKKGVNLVNTKSRNLQWLVNSELLTGGKHSTATVDVAKADGALPRDGDSSYEIMQLDFEMENFTSQAVTRRIMWHIDYRGRNPPPDLEKVVTELTVIQRDIRAIVPLAMDTEIINTAILTGRTVAIPVKVIAIEMTGVITDVSAMVECKSNNEDIIKVSSSCDYVFVSGKETRGSMNARVTFSYEHLSALLEMTVWVPKLPLHIELLDPRLSQVKGWRVPILPDRRSVRESEDDEDEDERKQSRGCTLQYQHSTLQVFTQFHTTSSEGTDQVITMLGPDWLVEVTDLVSDFMKVDDPRVAQLVDSSTLAGREPGTTLFKMDHSHHWVFLGNGQPLRVQNDLSPPPESPGNPLESVQTCCHGDHHSSGSSQTSVQSQVHGRGDGSSGGSTRDQSEDPLNSPTSKRKRVKFTTFATLPSEELAYNSIPIADEEDLEWVCQDMGLQDPEALHDYICRIKEIA
ncbi:transmembrane protein 132E [Terrapene carolina triunguis]|uniref:transmembrane protein 132E n=1 Tax=Terrapene triunguis TaxID=2587831 RepID=UPI000E77799E|nr:transmembrane protein 132E [Terrapene carolina triunguis]